MRVHLFEQFAGGHHTNYLAALLAGLGPLVERGFISEINVSITRRHYESVHFTQQLAHFENIAAFDPSIRAVDPKLGTVDRFLAARNYRRAVQKHPADLTISTSADPETLAAGIIPLFHVNLGGAGKTIGLIHTGYAGLGRTSAAKAKDMLYQLGLRHAPWTKIGIVNPLVFDWAMTNLSNRKDRFLLVPDPVPLVHLSSRDAARTSLGVPLDGRYIGHVGTTDDRKAIPELIHAFKMVRRENERLLLAGKLSDSHAALLHSAYADLLATGDIQIVDRYLSPDEIDAALSAVDLAAVLHRPRVELSASLLRAVAAERPVLVDGYGYAGDIVRRFQVGQTCDVRHQPSIDAALRAALDEAPNYIMGARTKALLEFHSPANFVSTLLASVAPELAQAIGPTPILTPR